MNNPPTDNQLAGETSPYLLQHSANPVDWHPWGEAALQKARDHNKPILLSIGYSACHWCHVMAHESFEDQDIAGLMNQLFVNIKVDREERPDIDKIYQTAHQLLTQRPGGWPLTMFLTPSDQLPFFGGTYFPSTARYGMPAFPDLLRRVAEYFETNREDIAKQGDALLEVYQKLEPSLDAESQLNAAPLDRAREVLEQNFDQRHGGFGPAPKFPHPSSLERLLRHWRATASAEEPDVQALYLCARTMQCMAQGGVYDQLGGGFFRYSVDEHWMIPHFEKMLYDNGPLLALYSQLWQSSGDESYRRVAIESAEWALREMCSPEGAFYSSLDADSEGHEGRFYVWRPEKVQSLVSETQWPVIEAHFGLDRSANFEGDWHLHVFSPLSDIAGQQDLTESGARGLLDEARASLLEVRSKRIWPARDDKLLTSWNALMIRGLSIAARCTERPEYGLAAHRAIDFIRTRMWVGGRLCATFKDERARFAAYLDDHAYLIDALLESLQTLWRDEDLRFAIELGELLLSHFEDPKDGGFFFTADDHETLIHRPKPLSDDSVPSGNGIAASALGRLAHLTGDSRYALAAERTLTLAWDTMRQSPSACMSLLNALDEHLDPIEMVIIRGDAGSVREWQAPLQSIYAPRRAVFAIPAEAVDLPDALALRAVENETVAYICREFSCSAPIRSLPALMSELDEAPH